MNEYSAFLLPGEQEALAQPPQILEITATGVHVLRDEQNRVFVESYVNATPHSFFEQLAGVWNRWKTFFQESMPVSIPDEWLLESA